MHQHLFRGLGTRAHTDLKVTTVKSVALVVGLGPVALLSGLLLLCGTFPRPKKLPQQVATSASLGPMPQVAESLLQQYIAEGSSYFNALNDTDTPEDEPG